MIFMDFTVSVTNLSKINFAQKLVRLLKYCVKYITEQFLTPLMSNYVTCCQVSSFWLVIKVLWRFWKGFLDMTRKRWNIKHLYDIISLLYVYIEHKCIYVNLNAVTSIDWFYWILHIKCLINWKYQCKGPVIFLGI
jgi:hypothetical protein